jgi:DNA-binding transcriptional ArsR family regulator
VLEALYRLRHGQGRIGKSKAAVLEAVVECPGASRSELAATLGKKPDSLSRPLKELVERGLIERSRKGRYWLTNNWQDALDRERTLTGRSCQHGWTNKGTYGSEKPIGSTWRRRRRVARGRLSRPRRSRHDGSRRVTPTQAWITRWAKDLSSRGREA